MAEMHTRQIEDLRRAAGPFPEDGLPVRTQGRAEARPGGPSPRGIEKVAQFAGRAVFGAYFLYNGINHFLNRQAMAEYARAKGVPYPDVAVLASGALIAVGGLSLIAGARPKVGAGFITGFLLVVSPQMHAYWKERDPQQRMQEMVNFTKNMALVGASLLAAAQPEPWPLRVAPRPAA